MNPFPVRLCSALNALKSLLKSHVKPPSAACSLSQKISPPKISLLSQNSPPAPTSNFPLPTASHLSLFSLKYLSLTAFSYASPPEIPALLLPLLKNILLLEAQDSLKTGKENSPLSLCQSPTLRKLYLKPSQKNLSPENLSQTSTEKLSPPLQLASSPITETLPP